MSLAVLNANPKSSRWQLARSQPQEPLSSGWTRKLPANNQAVQHLTGDTDMPESIKHPRESAQLTLIVARRVLRYYPQVSGNQISAINKR